MTLQFHSLANIFPLIEGAKFDAMVVRLGRRRGGCAIARTVQSPGKRRYRRRADGLCCNFHDKPLFDVELVHALATAKP